MSKASMNTSGRVCEKLLTGWNQFWLHVTTVRLLLCGRTLSRLAGGNFTACKQDWESAAQSTPEGCSLQPNRGNTSHFTCLDTHGRIVSVNRKSRLFVEAKQRIHEHFGLKSTHHRDTASFFSCQWLNATHTTFPLVQLLLLSLFFSARPWCLQRLPSLRAATAVLIGPPPPPGRL